MTNQNETTVGNSDVDMASSQKYTKADASDADVVIGSKVDQKVSNWQQNNNDLSSLPVSKLANGAGDQSSQAVEHSLDPKAEKDSSSQTAVPTITLSPPRADASVAKNEAESSVQSRPEEENATEVSSDATGEKQGEPKTGLKGQEQASEEQEEDVGHVEVVGNIEKGGEAKKKEQEAVTPLIVEVDGVVADSQQTAPSLDSSPNAIKSTSSSSSQSTATKPILCLRLIISSGSTAEFVVNPDSTVREITAQVHANWPQHWHSEQVPDPSILRLIYQGRFLHSNITMKALNLQEGQTVVMHLIPRETLPESNLNEDRKKAKGEREGHCCSLM